MARKKLGLFIVKVSICSVFIYTCPTVLPVSTIALLFRKSASAETFYDSCLSQRHVKMNIIYKYCLYFQKPVYVRKFVSACVQLGLRRRHWNKAVYSALDIVYCSVVRKCSGRYLLAPLLFLRERNGARQRIDYRLENRKDAQGVREQEGKR